MYKKWTNALNSTQFVNSSIVNFHYIFILSNLYYFQATILHMSIRNRKARETHKIKLKFTNSNQHDGSKRHGFRSSVSNVDLQFHQGIKPEFTRLNAIGIFRISSRLSVFTSYRKWKRRKIPWSVMAVWRKWKVFLSKSANILCPTLQTWVSLTVNCCVKVIFLSLKRSVQNQGSTYSPRLKSKPLTKSGQQVEECAEQSIYTTYYNSADYRKIFILNSCLVNIFNKLTQRLIWNNKTVNQTII